MAARLALRMSRVLGATAKNELVWTRRAAKPSIPETDRILDSGLAAGSPDCLSWFPLLGIVVGM
jgi:hypothetical protein